MYFILQHVFHFYKSHYYITAWLAAWKVFVSVSQCVTITSLVTACQPDFPQIMWFTRNQVWIVCVLVGIATSNSKTNGSKAIFRGQVYLQTPYYNNFFSLVNLIFLYILSIATKAAYLTHDDTHMNVLFIYNFSILIMCVFN